MSFVVIIIVLVFVVVVVVVAVWENELGKILFFIPCFFILCILRNIFFYMFLL